MPGFTQTESDYVKAAYNAVVARVENLAESIQQGPSEIRQAAFDAIDAHLQQITDLGFLAKTDFTPDEIKATLEAAAAIMAIGERLDDTHEFTLIELNTDLAELLQKLCFSEYVGLLRGRWAGARSSMKDLPEQIPEDVIDEYNVGIFNKTQVRLNQIANNVSGVAARKCLNSDDYARTDFNVAVLNACNISSTEATRHYIDLEQLKAAERAVRAEAEAAEVGILGKIWAVVGWDDPYDFLLDVGLAIATGGASKVAKWGKRLARVTQKTTKAVTKLEKLLNIEERARRLEHRISEVRAAAEKLRRARNFLELPNRIKQALSVLNSAQGKLMLTQQIGEKVSADYLRSITSSVIAQSTGMAGTKNVGAALSKELAKASIISYLNSTPLGKELQEAKAKINFAVMIAQGFNKKAQERIFRYFGLVLAREFIARTVVTMAHKRTNMTAAKFENDFIDSMATAVEALLLEVPFVSEANLKAIGRTIVTTIRKVISEIAKELAYKVVAGINS
jgi:hypothetical protein